MPGFACAVSTEPLRAIHEEIATRIAGPLNVRSNAQVHAHEDAHAAFVCATLNPQCGIAHGGDSTLLIYGEPYDPEKPIAHTADFAPHLLDRVHNEGAQILERIDGQYVALLWNAKDRALTAVIDRLNGARLHFWHDDTTFIASTHIAAILSADRVSTAINDDAVAEFMCMGNCLEDRTLLRDIQYLQGARKIHWASGCTEFQHYWEFPFESDDKPELTVDKLADDLYECVCTSMNRRKGLNTFIPISGGLDSRTIMASAHQQGAPAMDAAFTMGTRGSYDVSFGRSLANLHGVPHTTVPVPETFYQDFAQESARRTNAGIISHTCWRMASDAFLERQSGRVMLNGYRGDYFHGIHPPEGWEKWNYDEFIKHRYENNSYWKQAPEDEVYALFKPGYRNQIKGQLFETIRRIHINAPSDSFWQKNNYLDFTNIWARRFQRMLSDHIEEVCRVQYPLSDVPFVELGVRMPQRMRWNIDVMGAMVRKYFPKAARVPSADSGLPLQADAATMAYHRMIGFLQFKAVPRVTFGKAQWRNRRALVHYAHWLRTANRAFAENLILDAPFLEDHFDMDTVRRSVQTFLDGNDSNFGLIYNLGTVALFQKQFVNDRGRGLSQPPG